jgi:hypothetical protein
MRTAERLAELEAIRDRSLTDAEQKEVKALAKRHRWNGARNRRYRNEPDYRDAARSRALASWRRKHPRMEAAE